jgi:hypothetical protein
MRRSVSHHRQQGQSQFQLGAISFFDGQRFLAAKRRKNTAHGVSRGYKWEMTQPPTGRKKTSCTHSSGPEVATRPAQNCSRPTPIG